MYLNISTWYPWRLHRKSDRLTECRVMQKLRSAREHLLSGLIPRVQFLCVLYEMVRACCLVALIFVLLLRIFLSCCCCLIIILQVSREEEVKFVFWFILWSRSKWTLQSLEKTMQSSCSFTKKFAFTLYICHCGTGSRQDTIFLFASTATFYYTLNHWIPSQGRKQKYKNLSREP